MRAAKYNEKLLTRAGAVEYLPGVTEDSLKKYELDITRPPNVVVALMADAYNEPELTVHCEQGAHNVSDVMGVLAAAGITCGRMYAEPPTLNDVFLEITGKELRD